jgi:hypothetical protein
MTVDKTVNLPALATGVTTLLGAVGALTATGVLGRLERNEPRALTAAVIVVLLGAVMFVIAGLPVTTGRSEIFATLVGTGLTVVGIGWAMAAGILTAGHRERPEMEMALDAEGTLLEGKVEAANLASRRRLVVLVEGLTRNGEATYWDVFTLAQYYVGPDGDGKIDMTVKVVIPPDEFDSVGVKAWTDDEPDSCDNGYPRRLVGSTADKAGTGCVVLPLPKKQEAAEPAAPKVALTWVGERRTRARLRVTKADSTGQLLVLAAGRRGGRVRQLLRTLTTPPGSGAYRATLRVDAGFTRICARALIIGAKGAAPKRLDQCPLARALTTGAAGAELRRP